MRASSPTAIFPRKREVDDSIRERIRRCEARQQLSGQCPARGTPEDVVPAGGVRVAQIQPRADDATASAMDERHLGSAHRIDDPDVRETTPVRVPEEDHIAGSRLAPESPPRPRDPMQP
jgi:hypothetical protein